MAYVKQTCGRIVCDICGGEFEQKVAWQLYCSRSCKVKAQHYNGGLIYELRTKIKELEGEIAKRDEHISFLMSTPHLPKPTPYWKGTPSQVDRQALQGEEDQSTKWGE